MNTNSAPSNLHITDLRSAVVWSNYDYPIIRIDHCAASLPRIVALEHNGPDLPFWPGLVTGLPEDYLQDGYVAVPEAPGLGVDLNYEGIEANLRTPGLFEPTPEWDKPKLGFYKPDNRWS